LLPHAKAAGLLKLGVGLIQRCATSIQIGLTDRFCFKSFSSLSKLIRARSKSRGRLTAKRDKGINSGCLLPFKDRRAARFLGRFASPARRQGLRLGLKLKKQAIFLNLRPFERLNSYFSGDLRRDENIVRFNISLRAQKRLAAKT
jgi:hypothetical protein